MNTTDNKDAKKVSPEESTDVTPMSVQSGEEMVCSSEFPEGCVDVEMPEEDDAWEKKD